MINNALNTLINSGQVKQADPATAALQGIQFASQLKQGQTQNRLAEQRIELGNRQIDAADQEVARKQQQQDFILSQVDDLFAIDEGKNPEQDQYIGLIRAQAQSGDIEGAIGNMAKVLEQRAGMNVEDIFVDDEGVATAVVNQGGKLSGLQIGLIGPSKQSNLNIQSITDAAGNVTQLVTDPKTGEPVRRNNLGAIGKPQSGLDIQFGPDGRPTSITQGRGGSKAPKAPAGFRHTDPNNPLTSNLEAIPGGPATQVPAETAAKIALLEEGKGAFADAAKLLFEGGDIESGAVDEVNVFTSGLNLPKSEGRGVNQLLTQAIRAKLRAESGAVINDDEIRADYGQFFPSVFDTEGQKRSKMIRLGQFLDSAATLSTSGRGDILGNQNALSGQAPAQNDIPTPQTDADYNAIPSGGMFIDPDDGQLYRKP